MKLPLHHTGETNGRENRSLAEGIVAKCRENTSPAGICQSATAPAPDVKTCPFGSTENSTRPFGNPWNDSLTSSLGRSDSHEGWATSEAHMHAIIYFVGLVVIVLAIVNFVF
jgi:hypothetical protein